MPKANPHGDLEMTMVHQAVNGADSGEKSTAPVDTPNSDYSGKYHEDAGAMSGATSS